MKGGRTKGGSLVGSSGLGSLDTRGVSHDTVGWSSSCCPWSHSQCSAEVDDGRMACGPGVPARK